MSQITYKTGNAVYPDSLSTVIIAHICNDIGAWGAGFVLSLSKRWAAPETEYRKWHSKSYYMLNRKRIPFQLSQIQLVPVEPTIYVANMIGQEGIRRTENHIPIRYKAVELCLNKLATEAHRLNATVHMPRIGCGLAGGSWDIVEQIIYGELLTNKIDVFVYDLKTK